MQYENLQDIQKARLASNLSDSFGKSESWIDLIENEDFCQYCCDKNKEDRDSGELGDLSIEEKQRLAREWNVDKNTYKNPYSKK